MGRGREGRRGDRKDYLARVGSDNTNVTWLDSMWTSQ